MPRLVHALPKYRLHRASGQAICTIAGRDFYLGPYRTKASKLEYDRVIAEWISAGRPASYGAAPHEFAVVELVVRYIDYAAAYYGSAKRGELATLKLALRPLRELYGNTTAAEFGPAEFKAIRQVLIDRGGARSYVNSQMQRVTRFFRWCAAEGLLTVTVPQTLAMIPGLKAGRTEAHETAPIRPVDPAVVEQTLAHLSPTVAAMVRVQLHTGCRPGEVVGLKVGDIDRRSEVWEARLAKHKNSYRGCERTLYFGPLAQAAILPFLLQPADEYLFSPAAAEAESRAARTAARRTPQSCGNRATGTTNVKRQRPFRPCFDTQSYGTAIARACIRAEVEKWRPNQLRHLVATTVRREFDLESASSLLGHKGLAVTLTYAETDRQRAIEVAKKIG